MRWINILSSMLGECLGFKFEHFKFDINMEIWVAIWICISGAKKYSGAFL